MNAPQNALGYATGSESAPKAPGLVVTFYSYKGGVGRSFLLANTAVWLCRIGFRVLCVDWDLEAPGLYHYFYERGLLSSGSRAGLVDLLVSLQETQPLDWRKLVRTVKVPDQKGSLQLLDAGDASNSEYGRKLAKLTLRESFENEDIALGDQLERLRAEWVADFDLVLLDSRTGLTDSGGICTAQLPDLVVAVFAPNIQGFDGALRAIATARTQRSLLPISRGEFFALPVLSRFDPQASGDGPEKWQRIATERLQGLYEPWRDKNAAPQQLSTLLRLPYVARWSFGEPLPVLEENVDDPTTVSFAIVTIAAFLVRRFAGSAKLVLDRGSYVREVIERGPALLDRAPAGAAKANYRYDLFLSFAAANRERARHIAQELRDRGRTVFFDERDLAAGTVWAEGLAEALRSARGLVVLTDNQPSTWQRAEVEAFLPAVRAATDRFVLPVLLQEQPAWPELFAFQAIQGVRQSPPQIASAVHEALAQLDAPKAKAVGGLGDGEGSGGLRGLNANTVVWSAQAALAAYRQWLVQQHQRLVPYFAGAAELLLEDVCIEAELEARDGGELGDPGRPMHVKGSTSPQRFDDLLLQQATDGTAPRWLVVGEPGAGKTTLARSLVHRWAAAGGRQAVFVPLVRVGPLPFDPIAFAVADMLGERAATTARGMVLRDALLAAQQRGQLALLFDGLDEVDPERLDALFDAVVAFAGTKAAAPAPIALLTRPIAVERRDLPKTFQRARIRPLREAQQDELLGKLLGAREALRVRGHLAQRPALAELAQSPLLLTLLAVVARDTVLAEAALPATRNQLYQTAVDLLLRRGFGVEKKGVKDQQPARRVLQLLSFRLHDQGGEAWTRAHLAEQMTALRRELEEANFLVKETWGSNDAFLDDIGHNAGLLGPHDGPNLPWRYLHRSLREFLVAEEVATWPEARVVQHVQAWAKAEVAEREQQRQSSRGGAAAKAEPPRVSATRWGEVYALLCGRVEVSKAVMVAIRAASPELMLRTLLQVDWLDGDYGLEFALATAGWDGVLLLRLVQQWMVPKGVVERVLWPRVTAEATVAELGQYWWLLEQVGSKPERVKFFAACGRPVDGAPKLDAVAVPAGTFVMGSPATEAQRDDDEGPQHAVQVGAFWLCRTAVTNGDYRRFDPKHVAHEWDGVKAAELATHPVVNVSWWEAYLFCRWLGDDVRLPSEAEWEYACRAGTTTPFSFGENITPKQVNYDGGFPYADGKKGPYRERTVPVGSLPANAWGLHEIHGNVDEWCQDARHGNYEGAPADGTAWEVGGSGYRVVRGGSWLDFAGLCRSAYRRGRLPGDRYGYLGFRPASSSPDHFTTSPPDLRVQTRANRPK